MVADSTTIRFKSNAQLGQYNLGSTRFNQRFASTAHIADTFASSHQTAAAPQFGLSLKSLLLRTALLASPLVVSQCKPEPIEQTEPTGEIKTWADAIASKTATTTQGPNGTSTTVDIKFKKFEDGVTIEIPEGVATVVDTFYNFATNALDKVEIPADVRKTSDGFSITFNGGLSTKSSFKLGGQGEIIPRNKKLPSTIWAGDTKNARAPQDMWQVANTPEMKKKARFFTGSFPTGGSSVTNPVKPTFNNIEGAKNALDDLLPKWGATTSKIDSLKSQFDDPEFKNVHANNPYYMVATAINEVKYPGHLASIMGANTQNAPLKNVTGTANNSSAKVYLIDGKREIHYGVQACKLDPDALAVLQRTEVMENNGAAGENRNSINEQVAQKLVMYADYVQTAKRKPTIVDDKFSFIFGNHTELAILANSGNTSLNQRMSGNVLGKNAADNTYKSIKDYITRVYQQEGLDNNQTTPIPPEMKQDLAKFFGITDPGDYYTDALINRLDTVVRDKFDWNTALTIIGYSPF